MITKRAPVLCLATMCIVLLVAACGGGGTGSTSKPPPSPPSALSYASPNTYVAGAAITPLTPTVSGSVTQYSVAPALPAGLTLDAASGKISGTPSAPAAAAVYTVTASNATGSTTYGLSITIIAVTTAPSQLSRTVVSATSVTLSLSVTPVNFSFAGTLTAQASDSAGVFVPTAPVAPPSEGAFALTLTTSTQIPTGHYTGTVTVALCNGPPCATPQAVHSVSIPYDVFVLSPSSAWPGNNLTTLVPWLGVPDWETFQGNAAHTGYVPVDLDPNAFSARWQIPAIDVSGAQPYNLNSLVTEDEQLFIGGGTTLYARKEFDGSIVWQYPFSALPFPSVNPPAVANGVVYVAAGQQSSTYMYAFNASDGTVVFQSPMGSQWEHYLAPTVGPGGVYTNAGTYGGLYAFSATGQQLLFANMPQVDAWTPAVDNGSVYAYTGDALHIVDPATGTVQTTIPDPTNGQFAPNGIGGSAVLGAPGSVFVADYGNSYVTGNTIGNDLLDFNVPSNDVAWKVAGNYPTTPAYNAGVLYVANDSPMQVEARSEADGALLWSWVPQEPGETGFESETLVTNNLLFVSTNLATYAIDLSTHQAVWSYPVSGKLALSQSGILYISGQLLSSANPPVPGTLTAINVK